MKSVLLPIMFVALLSACESESAPKDLTTEIINNSITSNKEETKEEKKMPFFEFVDEVKEFGTITQGESVSTTFRFKNVGEADLIISSAQGSCGCAVPQFPKEPIKPGEEGVIDVVFNSAGKQGLQNKNITLVANTVPNTKILAIKGEVLAPETAGNPVE